MNLYNNKSLSRVNARKMRLIRLTFVKSEYEFKPLLDAIPFRNTLNYT